MFYHLLTRQNVSEILHLVICFPVLCTTGLQFCWKTTTLVSMSTYSHMHEQYLCVWTDSMKRPSDTTSKAALWGLSAAWPSHTSPCPLGGPTAKTPRLIHVCSSWDINEPIHSKKDILEMSIWLKGTKLKHLNFTFRLKTCLHTNPVFQMKDENNKIQFKYWVIKNTTKVWRLEKEDK